MVVSKVPNTTKWRKLPEPSVLGERTVSKCLRMQPHAAAGGDMCGEFRAGWIWELSLRGLWYTWAHSLSSSPPSGILCKAKNIQLEKEIQTQQQNATLSVFDPNETIAGIWKQRSRAQDQGEKGKTLNSCLRRFLSPGGAEWHRLEPPLLSEKRCQEEELPWLASYRTGGGVFANYCLAAAEFLIPWQPSTPGLFWVDQIIQVTKTLKTKTKQKYRLRGFRELPLGQWSDFGTDVGVFC